MSQSSLNLSASSVAGHGSGRAAVDARALGRQPWLCLLAVLASATVTSWLQTGLVPFKREVLGSFSWGFWLRDQLLLSSVGYAVLFAALALLPLLLHLVWPRRVPWHAFVGTMAALASFSVLLIFDRIAPIAWFLVAVGVGFGVHGVAGRRPHATRRWIAVLALAGNVVAATVAVFSLRVRVARERAAIAALPAASPGAPNVLLLILDTVRASSLSLHGAPWSTTPALAARAESSGVVFDAAYSAAPWTLPSHASMFTGHWPSQTSADHASPLDETFPTLAEVFRDHGYATGGFSANINIAGYRSGLARGFIHYEDAKLSLLEALFGTTLMQSQSVDRALRTWARSRWPRATLLELLKVKMSAGPTPARHDGKLAEEVTADVLRWIPQMGERPFFVFVNYFDAHGPMPPPWKYQRMFEPAGTAFGRYSGAIRYIDDSIDVLLRELASQGALANTIVVVASDHGEHFGEHKLYQHGNSLYRPLLHVPLVVLNAPGAVPGSRVRRPVSLRDLPATLLDLAGIVGHELPGQSLRPLLTKGDSAFALSPVISELKRGVPGRFPAYLLVDRASLVDDSSHVIQNSDGVTEVFRYPADTAEHTNLATDAAIRAVAEARLHRALQAMQIVWRQ